MSVERVFYCDGPGDERSRDADGRCQRHIKTPKYRPPTFVLVEADDAILHFCGWDCVMKYAAAQPLPEFVDLD